MFIWIATLVGPDLFTLAVEVDEREAGAGDVLGGHPLVHAVDIEVQAAVAVHQQSQHRALGTRVQVGTIVLTDLMRDGERERETERERERAKALI